MTSRVFRRLSTGCRSYLTRRTSPSQSAHLQIYGTEILGSSRQANRSTTSDISLLVKTMMKDSCLVFSTRTLSRKLSAVGPRQSWSDVLVSEVFQWALLPSRLDLSHKSRLQILPTPIRSSRLPTKPVESGTRTLHSRRHKP